MNITFELCEQDKFFAISFSPNKEGINVLTYKRKDIWKKSEVQNIINTLNLLEIPIESSDEVLREKYSKAVDKELQRQCDVWNSKGNK